MQGKTAYERLRDYVRGVKDKPVEFQFFNPLGAKLGWHVRLMGHAVDGRALWIVRAIYACQRQINNNQHPYADYVLEADDDERSRILRVFPQAPQASLDRHECLWLEQYWPAEPGAAPWDADTPQILAALMDPEGKLVQYRGTPDEALYERDLCNVRTDSAVLSDRNGDGKLELDEVYKFRESLWTFRRKALDIAGAPFIQHLHVHLSGLYNPSTGEVIGGDKDLIMHRGESVAPHNLTVYGDDS